MKIYTLFIILISFYVTLGNTTSVAVLILARGGSKGVHLKNLKTVGGRTLIRNTVETARSAGIADVTVSTDHLLIALEALRCNASVFRRSAITASDWAPSIWGAQEFLALRSDIEILVLVQATSPFVKATQLRGALNKIRKPKAFDCIFAITRSYKLRWQINGDTINPINFDANNRPRRQDWSGEFLETGAFYIARKSLINNGLFQNKK